MAWTFPESLDGRHTRLERLDAGRHAPLMFQHFTPSVTEFLASGGEPITTEAGLREHLQMLIDRDGRINWAVQMRETGAIAGRVSFLDINESNKRLEMGTMLMPPFWGGPANRECKLLLMGHAFDVLGANRVHFKIDSRNARSIASMHKLGAVNEGVLRQYQIREDGFVRDSVMFSVLRSEWPPVKAGLLQWLAIE